MAKLVTLSAKETDERRAAVLARRASNKRHLQQEKSIEQTERLFLTEEAPKIATELIKAARLDYIHGGYRKGKAEKLLPVDAYEPAMVRHLRKELKRSLRLQGLRHFHLAIESEEGDETATFALLTVRKMETTS